MEFAMKPTDIKRDISVVNYVETEFFKFAFTRKNWFGDEYIGKEELDWFSLEIRDGFTEAYRQIDFKPKRKRSFLVDTSIFINNQESNQKLLGFLESIPDDFDLERDKKITSKVRYYCNKLENLGYMHQWGVYQNEDVKEFVLEEVEKVFQNSITAFMKKNSSRSEDGEVPRISQNYSIEEEKHIAKIIKYSFSDPELFVYNSYWIAKWFDKFEKVNLQGATHVINVYSDKGKNVVEVFQGPGFDEACLYFEELVGHFLTLTAKDPNGYNNGTLFSLNDQRFNFINFEKLEELAHRATQGLQNRRYQLPKQSCWENIINSALNGLGIEKVSLLFEREVVNEMNEKELLVYCKVSLGNSSYVLYPLLHPKDWDEGEGLNDMAKVIVTYSLCLYHDIVVLDAYKTIKDKYKKKDLDAYEFFVEGISNEGESWELKLKKETEELLTNFELWDDRILNTNILK